MATGQRNDPYRGFNFKLEIDGVTRGGFREASGLDADGPEDNHDEVAGARRLPGLLKYNNILLKRGYTDDHSLWEWHAATVSAQTPRKTGSIVQVNQNGEEKARWNFTFGWPTKWSGPTFNAAEKGVPIKTLEISHEGLTKA